MHIQQINQNFVRQNSFKSIHPVYHWHKLCGVYTPATKIEDIRHYQRVMIALLNSRTSGGRKHTPSTFLQKIVDYLSKLDKDYQELPYVRSFLNYKGGYKNDINGDVIKVEPYAYILTGRDAVDFGDLYCKPIKEVHSMVKGYEDTTIAKNSIERTKLSYGYGGASYIRALIKKAKESGKPILELHTIFSKLPDKDKPSLIKLGLFQTGAEDNPLITNGILQKW